MPHISVELGLTLPIPNRDIGVFKQTIWFGSIDTEGDVDAQVKLCLDALPKVVDGAEAGLAQTAANMSALSIEGIGLAQEVTEFKGKVSEALKKIVGKMNDQTGELATIKTLLEQAVPGAKVEVKKTEAPAPAAEDKPEEGPRKRASKTGK
jgi:hypothetical protein